jgi:molybdopterin-guanine dinucleotide biosynthesis protein A
MGFVLAGGKSSRMGTDKAFVQFRGRTLLERALSVMGAVCGRVAIVGDPAKFAEFGLARNGPAQDGPAKCESVVADIFPGCGPLGGIHAALAHSSAELNLMLAVDMPFVSEALLEFLFAAAESTGAMITVPRSGRGLQPLCAVYRRGFSPAAEEALRAGRYKIEGAFAGVAMRVIEEVELAAGGFSERSFFNVNTPQDRSEGEGGRAEESA